MASPGTRGPVVASALFLSAGLILGALAVAVWQTPIGYVPALIALAVAGLLGGLSLFRDAGLAAGLILGASILLGVVGLGAVAFSLARDRPRVDRIGQVEPIVDEAYLFRLDPPGPEWRLLDHSEVMDLNPEAVAGAIFEATGFAGLIIVYRSFGAELEDEVALIVAESEGTPVEDPTIEAQRFLGQPARRYQRTSRFNGVTIEAHGIVTMRDEYVYHLYAGVGAGTPSSQADRFFESVTFLPGEITPRVLPITVPDSEEADHRIAARTFESYGSGVRVDVSHPWQPNIGDAAAAYDADAELVVGRRDPEVFATLKSDRARGGPGEVAAYVDSLISDYRAFQEVQGRTLDERESLAIGDHSAVRLGYRIDEGVTIHHEVAVLALEDRVLQLTVWSRGESAAQEGMVDLARRVRILTAEERSALLADLDDPIPEARRIGVDWSIRDGHYRDFAYPVSFVRPDRRWGLHAGDRVRATHGEETRVFVRNGDAGVFATIAVKPTAGAARAELSAEIERLGGFQDPVIEERGPEAASTDALALWGSHVFRVHLEARSLAAHTALSTTWALEPNAGDLAFAETVRSIRYLEEPSTLTEVRDTPDGRFFEDHRFGFRYRLEPGRHPNIETPPHLEGLATIVSMGNAVVVLALHMESANLERVAGELIGSVASTVGSELTPNLIFASTEEEEASVAGVPGTVIRHTGPLGSPIAVFQIHRGGTIFGLVYVGEQGARERAAIGRFELLE
ncbi:MAG: hypothetical protein AAGF12_29865 [Myxococcota bacterium]